MRLENIKIQIVNLCITALIAIASSCYTVYLFNHKIHLTKTKNHLIRELRINQSVLNKYAMAKIEFANSKILLSQYGKPFNNNYHSKFIVDTFGRLAIKNFITLKMIKADKNSSSPDFVTYSWQINATGTFENLWAFVNDILLSKDNSFLLLDSIEIQHSKPEDALLSKTLSFKAIVTAYQNKILDTTEPADFSTTAPNYFNINHNPFFPGLNYWPSDKLKLIGEMHHGKNAMRIIRDPYNEIHKIYYKIRN